MIEAAICNSYIISSDCPNGPKEFLNNGKMVYCLEIILKKDFKKLNKLF